MCWRRRHSQFYYKGLLHYFCFAPWTHFWSQSITGTLPYAMEKCDYCAHFEKNATVLLLAIIDLFLYYTNFLKFLNLLYTATCHVTLPVNWTLINTVFKNEIHYDEFGDLSWLCFSISFFSTASRFYLFLFQHCF